MTITERLFIILAQKKITQKEFAKQINVNEKTVSAWKKNNSLPPLDKISNISDFLDVSIEYLINGEEKALSSNLTEDEQKLIDMYRELTDSNKSRLEERGLALIEQQNASETDLLTKQ